MLDLGATLDPKRLAEAASDLNVRLMKWRALPELDERRLRATRVLLVGAGTLGCAVARTLLGWGFRHISFVDQARVSYSNPVRQSLFSVADCSADGGSGRYKADRAAEALREIHPSVVSAGHRVAVPMPGHAVGTREDFERFEALVKAHDVVCLLTDTRESRWLPTVLGVVHDKLTMNAALGFDNFLVMRHGGGADVGRPGCYFCNDVVAPQDSTKNRTMDQQCTVTRPGLAPVASALLVELLVGLLHHPLGNRAPADVLGRAPAGGGGLAKLGLLPHQIRGFLPTFQNELVSLSAFPECSACSERVVGEFRARGFEFVREVMADPKALERLTGLAELQRRAAERVAEEDFAVEEFDEEEEMEDEDEDVDVDVDVDVVGTASAAAPGSAPSASGAANEADVVDGDEAWSDASPGAR